MDRIVAVKVDPHTVVHQEFTASQFAATPYICAQNQKTALMRLAQLARKLSLKPAEIVQFLSGQAIVVEETANARVEDEHTQLVIAHFAPHLLQEALVELAEEPTEVEEPVASVAVPAEESVLEEPMPVEEVLPMSHDISDESLSADVNTTEELPDIIRAPKIELTGLKVLGKIELPEKKKKEEATAEGEAAPARERREQRTKNERRGGVSSVEKARERERKKQEEARKKEEAAKKEQRKQSYLKTREANAPVKKEKAAPKKVVAPTVVKKQESTSMLGRFMRWLTSNQ